MRPKWLSYGVALIHFVHVLIPASGGPDSAQPGSQPLSCIESEEMWEDEEGIINERTLIREARSIFSRWQ